MAHILVLNRMTPEVVSYADYLDHDVHRVSYLTTPQSLDAVAPLAERYGCALRVLDLLDDDAVARAVEEAVGEAGPVDRVVALSEIDILCAARLRQALGVVGQDVGEALLVRDKLLMKARVAAAGVRLARYVSLADRAGIDTLARETGWPLVLKPVQGWASIGVETVDSPEQLAAARERVDPDACIVEEHVDAPLYHADGLVQDGVVTFIKLSRYLNTPLAFTRGGPLGAWAVDDVELVESATRLARTVCEELSIEGPFHLEAFRADDDPEWTFSEVAGRAGGGPITRLVLHAYGVDLLKRHVALQAGLADGDRLNGSRPARAIVAGYLCVPEPPAKPCRVVSAPRMAASVGEIYFESVPEPGTVLDGTRHYLHIAAEFLFEAETTAALRAAVERTLAEFRLECEPVQRP